MGVACLRVAGCSLAQRTQSVLGPGLDGGGGRAVPDSAAQFLRAQLLSPTQWGQPLDHGGNHRRSALGGVAFRISTSQEGRAKSGDWTDSSVAGGGPAPRAILVFHRGWAA